MADKEAIADGATQNPTESANVDVANDKSGKRVMKVIPCYPKCFQSDAMCLQYLVQNKHTFCEGRVQVICNLLFFCFYYVIR